MAHLYININYKFIYKYININLHLYIFMWHIQPWTVTTEKECYNYKLPSTVCTMLNQTDDEFSMSVLGVGPLALTQ